jgi:hypothetical protein
MNEYSVNYSTKYRSKFSANYDRPQSGISFVYFLKRKYAARIRKPKPTA